MDGMTLAIVEGSKSKILHCTSSEKRLEIQDVDYWYHERSHCTDLHEARITRDHGVFPRTYRNISLMPKPSKPMPYTIMALVPYRSLHRQGFEGAIG